MGIFDLFKTTDVNEGVERCRNTANAVLLDVRTPQEFAAGRIPGSRNIPLQRLGDAGAEISTETPLYVYCQSGGRSRQAAAQLTRMGYAHVHNIGGICSYRGRLEV